MTNKLPKELKQLVRNSLDILGHSIEKKYGRTSFLKVEEIRQIYKKCRSGSLTQKMTTHRQCFSSLGNLSSEESFLIAHSFSLSLEIINCCENAYRSFRLKQKATTYTKNQSEKAILFVLTAHPTESRNSQAVNILDQLTQCLISSLESPQMKDFHQDRIQYFIHLLLSLPLSKNVAPSVLDEAEYIYSILFRERNLLSLCDESRNGRPVYIRTWVGGDKDGHPGVDEKLMLASLQASRAYCISFLENQLLPLKSTYKDLKKENPEFEGLESSVLECLECIKNLRLLREGDSQRISAFEKSLSALKKRTCQFLGSSPLELNYCLEVYHLFPGLVVPLELREDAEEITRALSDKNQSIAKMLSQLELLSKGGSPQIYVRGLIISMCESETHIQNANRLAKQCLKHQKLPIVPLFETRFALENSTNILNRVLADPSFVKNCNQHWGSKIEVMLGYSDSAKESGAFFSRVQIRSSLLAIEKCILNHKLSPIFFHGSGGSVARGGGSMEEQISWWPKSAKNRFKATIQGEMIQRTFASPEILKSKLDRIHSFKQKSLSKLSNQEQKKVESFSRLVADNYSEKLHSPDFLSLIQLATPYLFLDQLKLGSRPSKRKAELKVSGLRAIPWVLCWTQTRALFPVWWGVGSAWQQLTKKDQKELLKIGKKDPLFSSFIKQLAYSLEKVDLSIWFFYMETSKLDANLKSRFQAEFEKEYKQSLHFVKAFSGKKETLWFRPWLKESIVLRSNMIHPLNLLEIHAIQKNDIRLLRECVTGVASGMQTTG